MRKNISILFLLFCILSVNFAQDFAGLKDLPLKEKEDYKKVEPVVTECANFILTHSMYNKSTDGLQAVAFIIKWMTGTPDYTFDLDNSLSEIMKQDKDILGVYMCCLTKYCLENPQNSGYKNLVELNAVNMLLDYAEHPQSGVKKTKAMKKLIKLRSEGNLKAFLEKE